MDGLLINGVNAYETYGVMMDDGFLEALDAPAGLKDFLTFESRTANGTEYMLKDSGNNSMARLKARDLTLKFRILASETYQGSPATLSQMQADLQAKYAAFMEVLNGVSLAIQVPAVNNNTYRLVYLGQSITFNYSPLRTSCVVGAKFVEPDPTDRETLPPNFALYFLDKLNNKVFDSSGITQFDSQGQVVTNRFSRADIGITSGSYFLRLHRLPQNVVMGFSKWYGSSGSLTDYYWYTKDNVNLDDYERNQYGTIGTATIGENNKGTDTGNISTNYLHSVYLRKTSGSATGTITVEEVQEWINSNKFVLELVKV